MLLGKCPSAEILIESVVRLAASFALQPASISMVKRAIRTESPARNRKRIAFCALIPVNDSRLQTGLIIRIPVIPGGLKSAQAELIFAAILDGGV
jgi:hypothetical protein